jgi:hypothetical protein
MGFAARLKKTSTGNPRKICVNNDKNKKINNETDSFVVFDIHQGFGGFFVFVTIIVVFSIARAARFSITITTYYCLKLF